MQSCCVRWLVKVERKDGETVRAELPVSLEQTRCVRLEGYADFVDAADVADTASRRNLLGTGLLVQGEVALAKETTVGAGAVADFQSEHQYLTVAALAMENTENPKTREEDYCSLAAAAGLDVVFAGTAAGDATSPPVDPGKMRCDGENRAGLLLQREKSQERLPRTAVALLGENDVSILVKLDPLGRAVVVLVVLQSRIAVAPCSWRSL